MTSTQDVRREIRRCLNGDLPLRTLEAWAIVETTGTTTVETERLLADIIALVALMDDGWRTEGQVRDELRLLAPVEAAARR